MEALRASLPRPHLAARGSRAGCSCARPAAAARAPAVACSAASPQSHGAAVARQSAAPSRRDVLAAGIALLSLAPPLARADEEAAVQVRGTRLMRAPACSLRRGLFWLGTCPPYRNRFLSRRAFQEAADALAPAAPTAVVEVPAAPAPAPAPAGAASFTQLRDDTLAYSFEYPVTTGEGRQLSWVATREPMRYSAAAPLSADARQRIVCELANFKGPLTLTVVVGPPPPVLEAVGAPETWTPRQIVGALLADRSTGRVSSGQRVSLASVEAVRVERRGDVDYIFYETASRGGPTFVDPKAATYRRGAGVVARRGGYFYSLAGTCPERLWSEVEPLFARALDSFRLDATGEDFREPGEGLQFFSL